MTGGQGLNPQGLGGSENVGAKESVSSTIEDLQVTLENSGSALVGDSSQSIDGVITLERSDGETATIDVSAGSLSINPTSSQDKVTSNAIIRGEGGLQAGGANGINISGGDNSLEDVTTTRHNPTDVRNISSPSQGWTAYHDGSGTNTEGPAHYNGTDWISTVDGTTIS